MTYKIISPEDIVTYADEIEGFLSKSKQLSSTYAEGVTSYLDCYEDAISKEQMSGKGLSPYALCIEGVSPAYDKAEEAKSKISNLRSSLTSISSKISSVAEKQAEVERAKLSKAINFRILEERNNLAIAKDIEEGNKLYWECRNRGIDSPYQFRFYTCGTPAEISERLQRYTTIRQTYGV